MSELIEPGAILLVRVGANGTAIALALGPADELTLRVPVRRWKAASRSWTQPTSVDVLDVVGRASPHDVRRAVALRSITPDIRAEVRWTARAEGSAERGAA